MTDLLTRRAFAERLALAAAAPFVLEDLRDLRLAPSPPPQQPQQETAPSPLAQALAESIRLRYGDRLSADDLKTITQSIDARLRNVERLYKPALTNADEPDFVYAVYRGED